MSEREKIGKYLSVEHVPSEETGKTCVWAVLSTDSDVLGRIDWYPPWRCYVLTPTPRAVFNAECLDDLAEFLKNNREARTDHPTEGGQGNE